MVAVKAEFDGKKVIFPDDFQPPAGRQVIVIFQDDEDSSGDERAFWAHASGDALRKVWDNDADDVYNDL